MARIYREAPLNSVWEGTANMMCMDVRRAMTKDPRTVEALFDEVEPLRGADARFDALVQHTKALVHEAIADEFLARPMTETVARLLQASELLRHSSREVIDIFMSTRNPQVSGAWGSHYGTLASAGAQAAASKVVRRAMVGQQQWRTS